MEREVPDEAGASVRLPPSVLSAEKGGDDFEKSNDPVRKPCVPQGIPDPSGTHQQVRGRVRGYCHQDPDGSGHRGAGAGRPVRAVR